MKKDYVISRQEIQNIKNLFLNIDGNMFREQRLELLNAIERLSHQVVDKSREKEIKMLEALEGIQNLLDAVADIAYDVFGIDCLFIGDDNGN